MVIGDAWRPHCPHTGSHRMRQDARGKHGHVSRVPCQRNKTRPIKSLPSKNITNHDGPIADKWNGARKCMTRRALARRHHVQCMCFVFCESARWWRETLFLDRPLSRDDRKARRSASRPPPAPRSFELFIHQSLSLSSRRNGAPHARRRRFLHAGTRRGAVLGRRHAAQSKVEDAGSFAVSSFCSAAIAHFRVLVFFSSSNSPCFCTCHPPLKCGTRRWHPRASRAHRCVCCSRSKTCGGR